MSVHSRQWGGLINQGSTCYLNSLIQALFHLPLFRRQIFEIETTDTLLVALQSVFCRLQSGEQYISTTDLTSAFGWIGDEVSVQHDVHELLQLLLDRLEKVLKGTPHENFIRDMFCGELIYRSQAVEASEKYVSDRLETFYDLEVIVKDSESLSDSLEKLSKPETIEGVTVDLSEGIKKKLDIQRSLRLINLPPVLMIHPNRVTFDTETYELQTINSQWKFLDTLDLSKYIAKSSSLKLDKESREKIQKNPLSIRVEKHTYTLRAILIHSGTTRMGHYYAYIKFNDQWMCFNDEHVGECQDATVHKSAFGGQISKNHLYEHERASVLMYINDSCSNAVLDEEGITIPPNLFALRTTSVKFFVTGLSLRHSCRIAFTDGSPRYTAQLPPDYTLEDLKSGISTVLHKKSASFQLVLIGRLSHKKLEDVEKYKAEDVHHYRIVVAPTWAEIVLRISFDQFDMYMMENSDFLKLLKHLNKTVMTFVVDESVKVRRAESADYNNMTDFILASSKENAMEYVKKFHIDPEVNHQTKDVVRVDESCNGLTSTCEEKMLLELLTDYRTAQESIAALFEPNVDPRLIAVFRQGELQLPYPPLADIQSKFYQVCVEKNRMVYYTIVPRPIETLHHACIVYNGGWKNQPRIYLAKEAKRISLPLVISEALKQVSSHLSKNFKNRLQSEDRSPVARLLKIGDGSSADEVLAEEVVDCTKLYVLDPCPRLHEGYSSKPVFFWSSQSQNKYFSIPTHIMISDAKEESGKAIIERLWKRLQIPQENGNPKTDINRWMVYLRISNKKSSQKLGHKELLKDAVGDGELLGILIDRPALNELDGVPYTSSKEYESLVINS